MKKLLLSSLLVTAVVITGVRVDFAVNPQHRTAVLESLCKAGLPNLSRPPEVDAGSLGCAILGPKRTIRGFLEQGFEHSRLVVGDHYVWDEAGLGNETALFSGTSGLMERGGNILARLYGDRPAGCLVTVAKVTVEGWMTVSEGSFGHVGLAPREFYAARILSAEPASAEDLKGAHGIGWRVCPVGASGTDGHAAPDSADEALIRTDDGIEEVAP